MEVVTILPPSFSFATHYYAGPVRQLILQRAADWAAVGLDNIRREYPNDIRHTMNHAGDRPLPREVHPAFYGSFDWHSCVEMHWMLLRLLRVAPQAVPAAEIRAALDEHLTPEALAAEARYVAEHRYWQRPYGWGWALTLAYELHAWDAPDRSWAAAIRPLADALVANFVEWLPKAAYPIRHGVHTNSAFGLTRSLDYARAHAPELAEAITGTALRWFRDDRDYPAGYEPSGADFLSPALTEAELMARLLPGPEFVSWLDGFLPGLADARPAALFTPAPVSDATDGQIAHLHGLNLSRAWAFDRIAGALPETDPRRTVLRDAAARHTEASLDQATGTDYMLEHWLAAYAVLLLT
jgi:hypothetical protein